MFGADYVCQIEKWALSSICLVYSCLIFRRSPHFYPVIRIQDPWCLFRRQRDVPSDNYQNANRVGNNRPLNGDEYDQQLSALHQW